MIAVMLYRYQVHIIPRLINVRINHVVVAALHHIVHHVIDQLLIIVFLPNMIASVKDYRDNDCVPYHINYLSMYTRLSLIPYHVIHHGLHLVYRDDSDDDNDQRPPRVSAHATSGLSQSFRDRLLAIHRGRR